MTTTCNFDECAQLAIEQRDGMDLCACCAKAFDDMMAGHATRQLTSEEFIEERCAAIAREALGFDPRSYSLNVRAVDMKRLMAALALAYRAGKADC